MHLRRSLLGPVSVFGALALAAACSDGAGPEQADGGVAPSVTIAPTTTSSAIPTPPPDAAPDVLVADAEGTSDAAADTSVFVDPCTTATPVCSPTPPATLTEGSGLLAVDRCAFPLAPVAGFGANGALLTALEALAPKVTMAAVLADTNRVATRVTTAPGNPPGLAYALRWNAEDNASVDWIPQGLTGSADADPTGLVAGKRVVLVSFYEDAGLEKGVRIAITDVTDPDAPRYRFALLVEPTGSAANPSFKQVDIHAGGLVWFGSKLYAAQTGTGFRVFDMSRILQVAVDQDLVGCTGATCRAGLYKYVIPQIGTYAHKSACAPIFSWVSLDRTSTPLSLVSGEYCSGTACAAPLAGRVFRWPLEASTGLLRGATTFPTEAFLTSHRQVQGGAGRSGAFYLSSSAPVAGGGALYRVKVGKSATSTFLDAPEDLMVDEGRGWLWGLSEGAGNRVVAAMTLTSYPPPP